MSSTRVPPCGAESSFSVPLGGFDLFRAHLLAPVPRSIYVTFWGNFLRFGSGVGMEVDRRKNFQVSSDSIRT